MLSLSSFFHPYCDYSSNSVASRDATSHILTELTGRLFDFIVHDILFGEVYWYIIPKTAFCKLFIKK